MDGNAADGPRTLDARAVAESMTCFRDLLAAHRPMINRLNVYPVPDGDTGTNMLLTLEAVVEAIGPLDAVAEDVAAMEAVCSTIAHGSLMGARGNSGVILCQVLRGMTKSLSDSSRPVVDGPTLAAAIAAGALAAREAVLRPVEGTILSVADAAAQGAARAAGQSPVADVVAVLDAARSEAVAALWRTPEQLAVLAEAGVVDAGGTGLVLLFDALLQVVDRRPAPAELELPPDVAANVAIDGDGDSDKVGSDSSGAMSDRVRPGAAGDADSPTLRYEVMYLLHAPDAAIPAFKQVWAGVGDSIVVVGGDGLWNCHIHTDDIGAAVEAALDAGRPREIRVTDLSEQVEEEQWVRQASRAAAEGAPDHAAPLEKGPAPRTSVVAVATGDGVRRIFGSLGVASIVAGGQSMNPSTAEILDAIAEVSGDEVVLLPNNANIRPVAEQAAALAEKKVRVVTTRGIPEGFAALLEYDPQASGDENADRMGAASERVVAGEVTRAVRASQSTAGAIAPGDFIGLSRSGVESVGATLGSATCDLLARLIEPTHEIVTLIEGRDATPQEIRRVTEWLRAEHPRLTVERLQGGQPLYPFLVSIE